MRKTRETICGSFPGSKDCPGLKNLRHKCLLHPVKGNGFRQPGGLPRIAEIEKPEYRGFTLMNADLGPNLPCPRSSVYHRYSRLWVFTFGNLWQFRRFWQ